ncbi:hypothetical protein J6590_010836 [Homalodisca vitripennis]|nr:hypothetical protein J6590_010836 [Homalodisca vitripennis]
MFMEPQRSLLRDAWCGVLLQRTLVERSGQYSELHVAQVSILSMTVYIDSPVILFDKIIPQASEPELVVEYGAWGSLAQVNSVSAPLSPHDNPSRQLQQCKHSASLTTSARGCTATTEHMLLI